jgi:hypothetical protein
MSGPTPELDRQRSEGGDGGKVTALGVLLGLAVVTTGVFLILFFVVSIKYRRVRKKYIRVLTSAEPDLLTLKTAEDDDSPEAVALEIVAPAGDDDDDDKPLLM